MSSNIQNILDEEFKLLIRATRNELFHFISVQYNHYDLVRKVKNDLIAQYPKRPNHSFNLDNCNPETFILDILASKSGLVFIEKFDLIFTEPFRSLCIGFNQRRDLFSTLPIQIIVFIPSGEENLQNFQKAMPDVFSIVNPMIQLYVGIEKSQPLVNLNTNNNSYNFANIKEAKKEIERVEKRLKTLENLPENNKLIVSLKINLAESYNFIGEYLKSKALLEELLMELQARDNSDFENDIAVIENDLALTFQDLGDYEGAKKLLEKVMISDETKFGENHPTTARSYSNLATVLKDLGNYEGAKKLLEKATISDETNYGEKHPNTAVSYSNLALALKNLGDYKGAIKLFEKAMISTETNFGEKHPTSAMISSNLASVLKDLGDYEGAKKLFEKVMISTEANFGEKHPNTAVSYSNLAMVLYDLNNYQNAVDLLEKAHSILKNQLGDNHPSTKTIKENLEFVKRQMK